MYHVTAKKFEVDNFWIAQICSYCFVMFRSVVFFFYLVPRDRKKIPPGGVKVKVGRKLQGFRYILNFYCVINLNGNTSK